MDGGSGNGFFYSVVRQLMHTLAKFLFFLASAVTVVVIGAFFFVGLVGDSENATFALGWS